VFIVIGLVLVIVFVALFVVIFAENGLGDDIFFSGPVSQVPQAATLAAKREVRVERRIGRCFANGALVLHGCSSFGDCKL
jgi:hypothetical protein